MAGLLAGSSYWQILMRFGCFSALKFQLQLAKWDVQWNKCIWAQIIAHLRNYALLHTNASTNLILMAHLSRSKQAKECIAHFCLFVCLFGWLCANAIEWHLWLRNLQLKLQKCDRASNLSCNSANTSIQRQWKSRQLLVVIIANIIIIVVVAVAVAAANFHCRRRRRRISALIVAIACLVSKFLLTFTFIRRMATTTTNKCALNSLCMRRLISLHNNRASVDIASCIRRWPVKRQTSKQIHNKPKRELTFSHWITRTQTHFAK